MISEIEALPISGCFAAHISTFEDARGSFQKVFSKGFFDSLICDFSTAEVYLSTSNKNVIRGMHFQVPPNHHNKIVVCLQGSATDVLLDLRGASFGAVCDLQLSPEKLNCVVIPKGVAHGFLSSQDGTELLYMQDTPYAPESDMGILWSSIDYSWKTSGPTLSARDGEHRHLDQFPKTIDWA